MSAEERFLHGARALRQGALRCREQMQRRGPCGAVRVQATGEGGLERGNWAARGALLRGPETHRGSHLQGLALAAAGGGVGRWEASPLPTPSSAFRQGLQVPCRIQDG